MACRRRVAPSILPRMGWLDSPDQDWCTNPTGPSRMGWYRRKCTIKFNPSPRVSERHTLGCACLEIRLHLSVGSRSHHGNGPRKRCWPRPTSCLCVASAGCRQCVRQLLRTRRAGRFRYRLLSRWGRGSYTWGALEFDGIRLHMLLHPAMRIVRRNDGGCPVEGNVVREGSPWASRSEDLLMSRRLARLASALRNCCRESRPAHTA